MEKTPQRNTFISKEIYLKRNTFGNKQAQTNVGWSDIESKTINLRWLKLNKNNKTNTYAIKNIWGLSNEWL